MGEQGALAPHHHKVSAFERVCGRSGANNPMNDLKRV
jgi:hypothetical protein